MQPSSTYITSNYKMEACATNVRMFIHPLQLAFRPRIHDDLDMTCQNHMKGLTQSGSS